MISNRIYERDTDAIFIRAFRTNPTFVNGFAKLTRAATADASVIVSGQTKHLRHSGSIDIDVTFQSCPRLLIENKIDAGYSITSAGVGQPERYQATVSEYRRNGIDANSVLLAPQKYLDTTRSSHKFDCCVSYEELIPFLEGGEKLVVEAAIQQAEKPYEPIRNDSTSDFFASYREFVEAQFPSLAIKYNPNAGGTRPTGSQTIYFNVPQTLKKYSHLPTVSMSLQCRDKKYPSASVKIMIGKWGRLFDRLSIFQELVDIGGYLRPAGQSLGIVIDTPRLNTQSDFYGQIESVAEGLEAALRLQYWWHHEEKQLKQWTSEVGIISRQ